MSHLSASFSATIRVRLADAPGLVRAARPGDRRRRRLARRDRPRARRAARRRCATSRSTRPTPSTSSGSSRRVRAVDGVEVEHVSDRTFLMHLGGKIEMQLEGPGEDARRPLDGLHAGRRPDLPGDRRRPRLGLEPDDQAEHRRGRLRRHRRARARRHRAGGGDARDGGQGGALQGVRRRRRLAALPRDEGRRRDRRGRARRSRRASAASTSRTSRRRAASRSRQRLRAELDIPVFHDDQHGTAIVVLAALLNALKVVGKRIEDVKIVITGVGAAGIAVTDILLHAGARNLIGCDSQRRGPPRPRRPQRGQGGVRGADEPRRLAGHGGRGARRRRRLHRPLACRARHRAPASRRWPTTRSSSRWPTRRPRSRRRRSAGKVAVVATGPLRLPEPDQQRARVPRCLPRRARRAGDARSPRG